MIKAIVFDFDGLILDTEYVEFASWQHLYREHSQEMRLEDWVSIIGTGASTIKWSPYDDLKERLGKKYHHELIRARRKELFDQYLANEKIMPGIETLIAEAEMVGMKLAVASSSPREWVEGFLTQLGLRHHFMVVKTETDVKNAKPDPELYLSALQELGVTQTEAFALEDSANGTSAANAANHAKFILTSLADYNLKTLCEKAEEYYASEGYF
jgi:HAD superfamily hydrolase (TIGR01509 family)